MALVPATPLVDQGSPPAAIVGPDHDLPELPEPDNLSNLGLGVYFELTACLGEDDRNKIRLGTCSAV